MAEIHVDPDVVTSAIAMYFPNRQVEVLTEYNSQLRASNGNGISGTGVWNVCAAGDLNIKQAMDKGKCQAFANYLAQPKKTKFFAVCGEDKNTPGGKCVQDFSDLTVNAQQAEGLAKLYASIKSDDIQCNENVRKKTGPLGRMLPTYLQCSSNISKNFYEFQFNNTDGNIDKVNHSNFKKGICKLFNSDFTTKDLYGHTWDICSDINDEKACEKIDSFVRNANIGYIATWGPAWYTLGDRGYEVTSTSLPYCVLSETIIKGNDGTILIEHTAFGLDGRVFLAGIQRKGSQEIKAQIRSYVENVMGKENVKSFSCEDNYHTVKLKGRSGNDDLLQCVVNGELVDFFFDDLSEAWGVYDKSGREGMTCATWGGTFTGKRCIGLEDEKTCNTIRDANKELCPECKQITWNEKTKTCNLPSSVTANALRKGLNYTAIVGGAAVSVVITVGTLGTATVPTAVVLTGLAVETLGAGVELVAQAKIDSKADDFFVKANNCNNQTCAEQLIKEYLQVLSNQQNDLSDAEISAADKTFAILFDKIPNDAQFWQDIKAQGTKGQTLEDNKRGFFDITSWNSEQIWRAVGVSLQIIPTLASIGWRVAKHSDRFVNATAKLRSKLQATSKQLDNALGIKQTANLDVVSKQVDDLIVQQVQVQKKLNIIDPSSLTGDDVELYTLWKQYAPRNQSFDDFKKMGSLQKIREMSKNWVSWDDVDYIAFLRSETESLSANLQKIVDDNPYIRSDYTRLTPSEFKSKYPGVLEQEQRLISLEEELEIVEKRTGLKNGINFEGNYSTYDRNLKSIKKEYDTEMELWNTNQENLSNNVGVSKEAKPVLEAYIKANKDLANNYAVIRLAEEVPLENVDEIAQLRAEQIQFIVDSSPKLSEMRNNFSQLTDLQKIEFAQEISDELLRKNGTYHLLPNVSSGWLDEGNSGKFISYGYNVDRKGFTVPREGATTSIDLKQSTSFGDFINTLAHENGGHAIDYLNPNAGSLGAQANYVRYGTHGNTYDLYRKELTEQSAWRIGDVVESAMKTENPYQLPGSLSVDVIVRGNGNVIDRQTNQIIKYVTTEDKTAGMSNFFENLKNGNTYIEVPYSVNISDNIKEIGDMLQDNGLGISFNRFSKKYVIGKPEFIY